MDEDPYEVMKVRQVIRNHVFKNLKFVKGEGRRALTTNFEKKNTKILQYGKCHKKADLTRTNGYECYLMKLMDITEGNTPIEKRVLWWKTYSSHIQEEIRQLRGRTSTAI